MITENELRISNKSYTNKDFAVIYKEILDIAKKLSYKYDPEASNESDPFIVLLKLLAFVAAVRSFVEKYPKLLEMKHLSLYGHSVALKVAHIWMIER